MCHSSPWWQHWQRADTAATTTFATTGIEPVLPLWASLSASAGSWYHRCGPHYPHQQGAGTTIVGFITLSLCWSSGPAIMGVATYVLLLQLWFCHIGVGLIMSSWGLLRRHWAGPAVLWFTKSVAGWYLHRGVPYLIVVLACHVGAGLAWVSGSYFCHWAHLLLMGVPHPPGNPAPLGFYQHLILNSMVGVAGASGGVTIEISPHPSMRGGAGRKRGVIGYEHGRWWWGERKQ